MTDRAATASGRMEEALLGVTFPARAARLKEVRDRVRDALAAAGCEDALVGDVVIAVDEACQNIIRHAYGGDCDEGIEIDLRIAGEDIVIRLRDWAAPVDPAKIAPRDIDDCRPGGLGTHFMREIMDSVLYESAPDRPGNLLTMRKRIG